MRKIYSFVLFLFVLCSQISAETDSPYFFPKVTDLRLTDAYFEASGGLAFPLYFTSQDFLPMTSYGGLFAGGLGYNFGGWLIGFEYNRSMWGQGVASGALMNHFENNLFSFRIRRLLTHVSVKKLPPWLNLAPGLSFGVDYITTNYYPSVHAKEEGRSIDIKFGQDNARCFFGKISMEADFYVGSDLFIPFISGDWNTFYDTSIGGGFASFFTVSLGFRSYPLGLFHKNQIKAAKKEKERELAQKLAEEKQIQENLPESQQESLPEQLAEETPDYPPLNEIFEPVKASVSASIKENFTPDSDGVNDNITFSLGLENISKEPESWTLEILDPKNAVIKAFGGEGLLPSEINWDGISDTGDVVFSMNIYSVKLTVYPSQADKEYFGQTSVSASDSFKTGILMTVIIPDRKWKIIVNTIHFDPDRATFIKISEAQRKENYETLDSLAYQLKQHLDCSVIIEGYANNVTNTEKENLTELIPLSESRAESILNLLTERGIPEEMLSAKGMGGANPIAEWKDTKNWWKNRRVEFVIEKKD